MDNKTLQDTSENLLNNSLKRLKLVGNDLFGLPPKLCKCGCGRSLEGRPSNVKFYTKFCRDKYNNEQIKLKREQIKQDRKDYWKEVYEDWKEHNPNAFKFVYDKIILISETLGIPAREFTAGLNWGIAKVVLHRQFNNNIKTYFMKDFAEKYPDLNIEVRS